MKTWSRRNTLLAGAALILLANAVALAGVWWNRSGTPESRLTLSERELSLPYSGRRQAENSGLALSLLWRVAAERAVNGEYSPDYPGHGGNPEWLDSAHMAALGFTVAGADASDDTRRRYIRQLPRQVLLVLELEGAAWQQMLERARENVQRHEAAAAVNADNKSFADRAKNAREQLELEERWNSRLFAIDAGLDAGSLRTKYPDRKRFMIVAATVRPQVSYRDKQRRLIGYVSALGVAQLNVPFVMRPLLAPLQARSRNPKESREARFTAQVAVGQRLEPWIDALELVASTRH